MAKNIERAGDHVTNIAELVSFRTTGHGFDEARPKGSASLYAARNGVMSMAGAATTRRDAQTASIKPRVLIVEDETALVELLRYNLEQCGLPRLGRLRRRGGAGLGRRRTCPTWCCSTGCCR